MPAWFWVGVFMALSLGLQAQLPGPLLAQAEAAADDHRFDKAAQLYDSYLELTGNRAKIAHRYARALYEIGRMEDALEEVQYLKQKKSPLPAEMSLMEARILHALLRFDEAAVAYKDYLKKRQASGDQIPEIRKEMLHCMHGERNHPPAFPVFTDPFPDPVNSRFHEWAPRLEGDDQLVFSSSRVSDGKPSELSKVRFRPYVSKVEDGVWGRPTSMISSSYSDHTIYYGSLGGAVVFYQGENLTYGDLKMAKQKGNPRQLSELDEWNSVVSAVYGDKDIFPMNDSCFLFSGISEEGSGGYDIYYSCYERGEWKVYSFSETINSPFHERSPSMAPNGKMLFFASDRPNGLGGFDIYFAELQDGEWKAPQNFGKGVNSAFNDWFFVADDHGQSAVFSSDRKGGHGGYDLWRAIFKDPIFNRATANPTASDAKESGEDRVAELLNGETFYLNSDTEGWEEKFDDVLQLLANYLGKDRSARVNIMSFPVGDQMHNPYELYFQIKKSQQIGARLLEYGLTKDQIHYTSLGRRLSKLEKEETKADNIGVKFWMSGTKGRTFEGDWNESEKQDEENLEFLRKLEGLSYSVQVAANRQLFEGTAFLTFRDPMIRGSANREVLKYTVGVFERYHQAKNLRQRLLRKGYKGVFITAYIDGIRRTRDQLHRYKQQYTDLSSYINVD